MNPEQIEKHLEVLAEAEGGVARLREMILQLAVTGKLVEQRLVVESTGLGPAETTEVGASRAPQFQVILPRPWFWAQLGNISDSVQYGYTASASMVGGGCRLLRITDIQNNQVNWETVPYCNIEPEKVSTYMLKANDILVARTGGTVGKSYLVDRVEGVSVFASYLIRIRSGSSVLASYLKRFMESPLYWSQIGLKAVGTGQPNVNGTALAGLWVPVPPLDEQQRIVAKVDELMSMCDELERRQQRRHSLRRAAHTAALDALAQATTPDELARAWDRLKQHWDVLATHPDAVPPLRQAILQLAVQGRLVRQEPIEEPAHAMYYKPTKVNAGRARECARCHSSSRRTKTHSRQSRRTDDPLRRARAAITEARGSRISGGAGSSGGNDRRAVATKRPGRPRTRGVHGDSELAVPGSQPR